MVHDSKCYHRYLDSASRRLHNVSMELGPLLLGFLQRIAVGAGTVFVLLLVISVGLPRRSAIAVNRRAIR